MDVLTREDLLQDLTPGHKSKLIEGVSCINI